MVAKIFIAHTNGDNPCFDGLMSSMIAKLSMDLHKIVTGEELSHRIYYSTPAPGVMDGKLVQTIGRGNDVKTSPVFSSDEITKDTELIFLDCHPNPDSVSKDGSIKLKGKDGKEHVAKTKSLDHHSSNLPILSKLGGKNGNFRTDQLEPILPKVAGCHLAVKELLLDELLLDEFSFVQDNNDLDTLRKSYLGLDDSARCVKSLDYLRKLTDIIQNPNFVVSEKHNQILQLRKLLTPSLCTLSALAANTDLFSLGSVEAKESLKQIKIPNSNIGKSVEEIHKDVPQNLKSEGIVDKSTIYMGLVEGNVKEICKKRGIALLTNNAGELTLSVEEILEALEEMIIFEPQKEAIDKVKGKYQLPEMLLSDQPPYCVLDKEHTIAALGKEKGESVKVLLFPFSIAGGVNDDVLGNFSLSEEEKGMITDCAKGGVAREMEDVLVKLMKKEKTTGCDRVVCVLVGGGNVSLRSGKAMMEWKEGKPENHMLKLGFEKCGGHPQAMGCASNNDLVQEIIKQAKQQCLPSCVVDETLSQKLSKSQVS